MQKRQIHHFLRTKKQKTNGSNQNNIEPKKEKPMKYSNYSITAFTSHGNPARLEDRLELLNSLKANEWAECESWPRVPEKEPSAEVGSFSSVYSSSPENAETIIKDFCKTHDDIIVQMDYNCDEDDAHTQTRFYRDQYEFIEREYRWPSFKEIITPDNPVHDESSELHDFSVAFKIDGRFYARVMAPDTETALTLGNEAYMDADFGALECIDAEPIHLEDESGNYIDPPKN